MEDFRNRPKGEYLQNANGEQLYALTRHWISDLQFFKDDLNFLNKLIDKYLIWITKDENMKAVSLILADLRKTRNTCADLIQKTEKHLQQLANMAEEENEASRIFRLEHIHLENEISAFVKDFRNNRKETFKITEHILNTEELAGITGN